MIYRNLVHPSGLLPEESSGGQEEEEEGDVPSRAELTQMHLNMYARLGLRTLCLAKRVCVCVCVLLSSFFLHPSPSSLLLPPLPLPSFFFSSFLSSSPLPSFHPPSPLPHSFILSPFLLPSSPPQALSQEEYDHWLEEGHAAEIALENRDTLLFESACAIEKNLELLGKDLTKTVNIQLDISRRS